MSILDHHDAVSWRFYTYGEDDNGHPLFSFWMNVGQETGVCIYDRNGGAGMWLSTDHADDEYTGRPPSEGFKDVLRDIVGTGSSIEAERVEQLPDHEAYFFRVIHGTIEQKGKAPDELMAFLMEVADTELRIVNDD